MTDFDRVRAVSEPRTKAGDNLAAPAVTEPDLRATIADLANRLRVCEEGRNMALEALEARAAPAVTETDPAVTEPDDAERMRQALRAVDDWFATAPFAETNIDYLPTPRVYPFIIERADAVADLVRAALAPAVTEPDHPLPERVATARYEWTAPAVTEPDLRAAVERAMADLDAVVEMVEIGGDIPTEVTIIQNALRAALATTPAEPPSEGDDDGR